MATADEIKARRIARQREIVAAREHAGEVLDLIRGILVYQPCEAHPAARKLLRDIEREAASKYVPGDAGEPA